MLAAGDTFRAAAIAQLQTWGDRAGVPVISGKEGADAAGLVFDAHPRARAERVGVPIVHTPGRLRRKSGRMGELSNVKCVLVHLAAPGQLDGALGLVATVRRSGLGRYEASRPPAGGPG